MSNETRKSEATGEKAAEVVFRDHTFTISVDYDEWPVAFMESIEEGRTVGICKGALGPTQWRKVAAMDLKLKDLIPLSDAIAKALGFGNSGESAASSD